MEKLLNHIKRWNMWRKQNINAWWYKILVLLGICYSPTFNYYFLITDAFNRECKRLGWENAELRFDDNSVEVETKVTLEGFDNENSPPSFENIFGQWPDLL